MTTLHKKEVFGQLNPLMKFFKIWYVYGKRKTTQFFSFFISSNFHFPLMNVLVYVNIDQGIYNGKMKVARNEKRKKLCGFSFSINIPNFKAFLQRIKLTKNLFFVKSDGLATPICIGNFCSTNLFLCRLGVIVHCLNTIDIPSLSHLQNNCFALKFKFRKTFI